jgi:hypothetical protein
MEEVQQEVVLLYMLVTWKFSQWFHLKTLLFSTSPWQKYKHITLQLRTVWKINQELGQLSQYSDGLQAGQPGFEFWQGQDFLLSTMSRLALGPTQPPIQCIPGVISLGEKPPGHDTDHSPPSSKKIKNGGVIPPLPYVIMAMVELYLHSPICHHGMVLN